ncbi:MAG TPA: glycogen debranching protein GlgX [Anaerolineales bacterium]|nr:glycogen debranching protein GlgX [Anaerolineales bacterium]
MDPDVFPGRSYPLGATVYGTGVNFCVFSRNCTVMELLLFDRAEDARPSRVIHLDPERNRTFYYWHAFVKGVQAGQLYGYRAHGPYAPERGLRFDGDKLLLDPYTRAVAYGSNYRRSAAMRPGNNCAHAMKSVVVDARGYDWEGDTPLQRPFAGSVIYELHVGGFTRHPSSGVLPKKRGTYAGLVEKIPYLKDLGITAVELLPVQQFDEQEGPGSLSNYWGYSPVVFFAPHRGYSSLQDPLGPVNEFKDMVKALHKAGIEVILDVVFNHTAEGDHSGPTLSLRGLENRAYYILDRSRQAYYANYSGCGNAINANHSIVRRMIMDCLHYWVQVMHVDGFRFDLASVLARDELGNPLRDPPVLWEIESDPILAGTKIIAEAWDAAGLYQVGSFVGHRWAEWNGQYRDDVRRFVKSDQDTTARLAERIAGSRDLYHQPDREPNRSINFVTCHDGFTLNDLVSYNEKHNAANLSNNQDGSDANFSWNCGHEGPAEAAEIEALRLRQVKNMLAILFLSQGTPMLLMGDEVRRTQHGNNNVYCQDNALSWFDWAGLEQHAGLLRFARLLVRMKLGYSLFQQEKFWTSPAGPDVTWHGVHLNQPDWASQSHSLAFELNDPLHAEHLHVILNAYWKPLEFELPHLPPTQRWRRMIDTALPTPEDFTDPPVPLAKNARRYTAQPRSVVVLKAENR